MAQSADRGHPYVYLDGIVLKRSWIGEVRNVSLLVAIARDIERFWPSVRERRRTKRAEAHSSKHLKERGLTGVRLIISDACIGLAERQPSSCRTPPGRYASWGGEEVAASIQPSALPMRLTRQGRRAPTRLRPRLGRSNVQARREPLCPKR